MKTLIVILMILGAAFEQSLAEGGFVFGLNDKAYPEEVAGPHKKLPVLHGSETELLRAPQTNDILSYTTGDDTVTGRLEETGLLVFSNGLEFEAHDYTIQRVFQRLAEAHIMMHTPQMPAPRPRDEELVMPEEEIKSEYILLPMKSFDSHDFYPDELDPGPPAPITDKPEED